jgi:O-acetyl-ADP-ribose deacetylase (regulator of RNase III)
MIKVTDGDLLDDELNYNVDIIAHQVNSIGVMGGGVALAIKLKWPFVERAYQKYIQSFKKDGASPLGTVQIIDVSSGPAVANLFGQDGIGGIATDMDALSSAIDNLIEYMLEEGLTCVTAPWGIGAGLGGGNWDEIRPMIEKKFNRSDLHLEWRRI